MRMKALLQILLPLLLLLPHGVAGADSIPTVAILRFGAFFSFTYVENAIVDTLLSVGLVNETEHAILQAGADLEGEKINVYWDDANFDFAAANVIVEGALDRGADALIVLSTPTAQAAINITSDMDDPPAVLFTSVYNPFAAGIAQSTCIKPAHVTRHRIPDALQRHCAIAAAAESRFESRRHDLQLSRNQRSRRRGTHHRSRERAGHTSRGDRHRRHRGPAAGGGSADRKKASKPS